MNIGLANQIYNEIKDTKLQHLLDDLIEYAIRYSRIRTDYYLLSVKEKMEKESSRTSAHNVFIDCCNILSRNMLKNGEDNSWRKKLGTDRKEIGDFACYLHCILGIMAR
ncbi:MAG: hypothetical protein K9N09_09140 [Candidatus Cloacimonetes bacterium]|nr:hypothetical protein [Candidatus Cloacimonadota bacterium]MCF7814199.1 hypothetical protein [Candidatus Cloacimonadota bacterium]MCF7868852.1 hypothetical protein [Candidatus Cloacimonadota bacterium]MCF7884255.1 hypothetical protein [Candidatus Cloacimonadota bacterium]